MLVGLIICLFSAFEFPLHGSGESISSNGQIQTETRQNEDDNSQLRILFSKNGKHGFQNGDGVVVIEPKYKSANPFQQSGLAFVTDDHSGYLIDIQGEIKTVLPEGTDEITEVVDERFGFCVKGKWGVCRLDGKVIVEPTYDYMFAFSDGMALVNQGGERVYNQAWWDGGQWGFIDADGKLAIPLTWSYADSFSDGLARVDLDKFINKQGEVVMTVESGWVRNFGEGVAPIVITDDDSGKKTTRYVRPNGKTSFTIDGEGFEFHEGLARVKSEINGQQRCGFINGMGEWVVEPKYAAATNFFEGRSCVTFDDDRYNDSVKWGFINKKGEMVIQPAYQEPTRFRFGIAYARFGGTFEETTEGPMLTDAQQVCINRMGKVVKE